MHSTLPSEDTTATALLNTQRKMLCCLQSLINIVAQNSAKPSYHLARLALQTTVSELLRVGKDCTELHSSEHAMYSYNGTA